MTRIGAARKAALLSLVVFTSFESTAHASGLYFTDRGVRPMGRGGAFVAGADDLGAIWYNPAGLADAGTSVLLDFTWLHFTSEFTRRTQVTDAGGTVRVYESPTVAGTSPVLPIPTIAGSLAFGDKKQFTAAFGIFAPYTAITSYPIAVGGQPSPSRYSLVSLDGSALLNIGGYFAWKPIEEVRLGIGVSALVGTFASSEVFSASPPDRLIASPEDPKYDALGQLNVGPIFSPSANAGATFIPEKHVRIGISGQLPNLINAPATIHVRLPNAVEFDNAHQDGEKAHVKFELPAIVRFGVEVRPINGLRIEAAYVREFWTTHHDIQVIPDNVNLVGVTGFPSPFKVAPINLPRQFENANSYRLGGELSFKSPHDYTVTGRLGVSYDQSAIPPAYLSPLTIDLDKVTVSIGGGLHIGEHWRFDALYAHVFAIDQRVETSEAKVPRVNPVQGNPTATEAINAGLYSARADLIGVGLNYKF
ncbi:MAG: outer membrane protein transport protein [Polyangiaceae bacterium]